MSAITVDVLLDSTALYGAFFGSSLLLRTLSILAAKGNVGIYVSQVAVRECLSQHVSRIEEASQAALTQLDALMKLSPSSLHPSLSEAHRLTQQSCDQSKIDVINKIHRWLKEPGICEVAIDPAHGSKVVDDYFSGSPPFREPKRREDFPDAFIWQALMDLARKQSPIHFVSNDPGFAVAINRSQGGIFLHKDLQSLFYSGVLPVLASKEDYETAKLLRGQLHKLDAQIRTTIHSSLAGMPVPIPTGIGTDEIAGPFIIERILALRQISVDPGSISMLGNRTFLTEFSATLMLRAGYSSDTALQEGTFNVLRTGRIRGDYDATVTGSLVIQANETDLLAEISAEIEIEDIRLSRCELAQPRVESFADAPVEITADGPMLKRAIASARGILLIVGRSKTRKMRAASTLLSDLASAHADSLFLNTHGHATPVTVGTVQALNAHDYETYDQFIDKIVALRPSGVSLYIDKQPSFKIAEDLDTGEEMIVVAITNAKTEDDLRDDIDHLQVSPIIVTAK